MTLPELPMPGEEFDGGVVIASVWRQDDDNDPDGYPVSALLLLLDENPDFYRVQHIYAEYPNTTRWELAESKQYPNIVPAVRAYEDEGGDY